MYTTYATGDSNAVKLWAKDLFHAQREKCDVAPLMGKSEDSIIQVRTELEKGKGDVVRFNIQTVLSGDGFTEGQRAQGNGESASVYQDSVTINELGHVYAPPSENSIDHQRVPFDLREGAKKMLAEWWAKRMSVAVLAQAAGYLPYNSAPYGVKYTLHNTITAASTNRKMWATSSVTADQSLGSSDKMNLTVLDRANTKARVGDNMLRPVSINGGQKFVCYMHPQQAEDVMTNTSTGQWFGIQQAALQGGQKHGIYNGALGEYKGIVMRTSQDVPLGVHGSTGVSVANVRRAVLMGCQAIVMAHGNKSHPAQQKFRWTEKEDDHGRLFECGAWAILGAKKTVFNSEDQGVISISSYSAI